MAKSCELDAQKRKMTARTAYSFAFGIRSMRPTSPGRLTGEAFDASLDVFSRPGVA